MRRTAASKWDGTKDVEDCLYQKNAAVVSHFDPMREHYIVAAHSTFADCRQYRQYLLTLKDDVAQVSQCALIGEVKPHRQAADRD